MFTRRKANKSGSYSVQVVKKIGGRYQLVRSFGASKEEEELLRLEKRASEFIRSYGGQQTLDFADTKNEAASTEQLLDSISSIVQNAPQIILGRVYDAVGFGALNNEMLRHIVISRICQPRSKLATVDYLRRYCGYDVGAHTIYRFMDKLDVGLREKIQQISVAHTEKILGGKFGIVFYDCTTLYFESAGEESLRTPGFSKDGKTAEAQVVLGLLVSRDGYPLAYSIFNGGQYEGRTMIPIIDEFVRAFSLTDFIVVADAGLLSRKNIALLKSAGYKFILGGRIKKESAQVTDWVLSLEKDDKPHETLINGDERIIVSYSSKRAAKDAHNREKGIHRLRKAYSSGKVSKKNISQRGYNKFLVIENDVMVNIDERKIADDARWDGLKSYVTNTVLPASEVIERYHDLWAVERAFRISKGTLELRPMFHFTEKRIEAHVCICFMAYKIYKEMERILKTIGFDMSVDKVLDIAKTISTVTIRHADGSQTTRTMLLSPEQRLLQPLLPT